MKNFSNLHYFLTICLLLLSNLSWGQTAAYAPDELLIKFSTNSPSAKQRLMAEVPVSKAATFDNLHMEYWKMDFPFSIGKTTYQTIDDLLPYLNMLSEVVYAEPNYKIQLAATPNDPDFGEQWALLNDAPPSPYGYNYDISATEAWDIQNSSPNTKVSIIDTGVDWTHPDLVNNIWQNLAEDADGDGHVLEWNGSAWTFDPGDANGVDDDGNGYVDDFIGWDFVNNDNNPFDDNGHGTHVAGIVGAEGNNGIGIAGVTWDVQLVPLKFLTSNGFGNVSDAILAIEYGIEMGVDISNNSYSFEGFSLSMYAAIQAAEASGQLFVAAAGNQGYNIDVTPVYPAAFDLDNIVTVSGTEQYGIIPLFSYYNIGNKNVDFYAPGYEIHSTLPGNSYGKFSGTSMATPHVTGILALLSAAFPSEQPTSWKERLFAAEYVSSIYIRGRLADALLALTTPSPEAPETEFSYSQAGLSVTFYVDVATANTTYVWDFGDGNTITNALAQTHNYLEAGVYEVILTGTNGLGTQSTSHFISIAAANSCLAADSLELVAFYENMGGASWMNTWDLETPVSTWYGVTVASCAVTCLDFDGIPDCSSDSLLTNRNELIGNFPNLNLPNLKHLYLNGTFDGEINNISKMPSLETFVFSNNIVQGLLPNFELPSLKYLDLNGSIIDSEVPDFDNMDNLEVLLLNNIPFYGNLPDLNLPSLRILDMKKGTYGLSGGIPDFSNMPNLEYFATFANYTDDIPDFSNLPNIKELYLWGASTGDIPDFSNIAQLERLTLIGLEGIGNIPDFSNLPNLKEFKLQSGIHPSDYINDFTGTPTSNEQIMKVENINNQSTSTLPNFTNLPSLEKIDFSGDRLVGSMPTFSNLPSLKLFILIESSLTGNIPSLDLSSSLGRITILNNLKLEGSIPDFPNHPGMKQMNLGQNLLSGPIPNFSGMPNLEILRVINNQLSGQIPDFLNFPNIISIDCSSNQISGAIPDFSNAPNLEELHLRINKLSGAVPDFSKLPKLKSLNLESNLIESVPNFSAIPNVFNLRLSNNRIAILPDFDNFPYMQTIYISNNRLTSFPTLANINSTGLSNINAAYNDLTTFPDISAHPNLIGLYLNGNKIDETIPDYSTFSQLNFLYVDNNRLDFDQILPNLAANEAYGFKYAPQDSIPLLVSGSDFLVEAGGATADNTYHWYKNNSLITSITGTKTFTPVDPGVYRCEVRNSIATKTQEGKDLWMQTESRYFDSSPCIAQAGFIVPFAGCAQTPLTFTDDSENAFSYEWQVDGILVGTDPNLNYSFPTTGEYTVTQTVATAACSRSHSEVITISSVATAVSASAPTQLLCSGYGLIQADIDDYASYSWFFQGMPIGTTQDLSISDPGTYTLEVTDKCGNTASAAVEVTFTNDCVWPGDFNNDGQVHYTDLYSYGLAYGKTGDLRQYADTTWRAQTCSDWPTASVFGINDKHCDGNGDGLIDEKDIFTLNANYGLSHDQGTATPPIAGTANYRIRPRVSINQTAADKRTIEMEIEDLNGNPVEVYAAGFRYTYNGEEATVDFSNSLFGTYGEDMMAIGVDQPGEYIDLAITSITGNNLTIAGPILDAVITLQDLPNGDIHSASVGQAMAILNTGEEFPMDSYNMHAYFNGGNNNGASGDSNMSENENLSNSVDFYINTLEIPCAASSEAEVFPISGVAPYTYLWSNGETTAKATGLENGDQFVLVSDAEGRQHKGHFSIHAETLFLVDVQTEDASNNLANGSATVNLLGNTEGATFLWSNGQNTKTVTGLAPGSYQVTVSNAFGCSTVEEFELIGDQVAFHTKAFLAGPYDASTALMQDGLREAGLLPTTSPYDTGIEVSSMLFADFEEVSIVDWIQVELRDKDDASLILGTTEGFILRNGTCVGLDGISPLVVLNLPIDYYHIVLRQRNHLAIISPAPILLTKNAAELIDFTLSATAINNSMDIAQDGTALLVSGDANSDGIVDAADRGITWNERNKVDYHGADFNLDGIVDATDRGTAWNNRNKTTVVE